MKVLYISKAMIVAAYREKLRALRRFVDVEAIMPDRWGEDDVEPGRNDLPVVRRSARWHGRNHLHYYPGIRRIIREAQPDLVHIDEEPYSLVSSQLARICRARKIPALFFAWQNLAKRLPPPFGYLRRGVYRNVTAAIAGTETAAAVLRGSGFRKMLAVIPQVGIDPEHFRPDARWRTSMRDQLGMTTGQFAVGFAGHLEERKGVLILLEAVSKLPDVRLVMVGEGSERDRLLARATELGMAGRVRLVGRVPSEEIAHWFNAVDVTVLPSLSTPTWVEQFGRVLVESMACGVPVIGSDSGEIPSVVGDAGVVVPEGDSRALGSAIAHFQRSPDQRRVLGERGRLRASTIFSHDVIARDTVEFYRRIIAEAV